MRFTKRSCIHRLIVPALALAVSATVLAQTIDRTERIQFQKGSSSAILQGRIQAGQSVDYVFGARKGQLANISLGTKHAATYFNLMTPGQSEVAFFIGSVSGNQFEGVLPQTGDFRVRVYMMRSAARRNEVADYRLEVVIAADQVAVPIPPPR